MWSMFKRLFVNDPDKSEKTNSFKAYFDETMNKLQIVNKQLIAPPEPQLPTKVPEAAPLTPVGN